MKKTADGRVWILTPFIIPSLILLLSPYASAEINYQDMKGIHALLAPECEKLSPIHGFTALKTGTLSNLRFFGNYGPENANFACHAQVRGEQRQKDCPQDSTAALIQQLFPSPDGMNFVANQGSKDDPISQLSPLLIGKLLEKIRGLEPALLKNPSAASPQFQSELTQLIYEDLYGKIQPQNKNYQTLRQTLDAKTSPAQKLQEEIDHCQTKGDPDAKIKDLKFQLDQVNKQLTSSAEVTQIQDKVQSQIQKELVKVQGQKKWKAILPFVQSLLGAIVESHPASFYYSPNTVAQSLLAYLWKKANTKEDLLKFLQGMPSCMKKANPSGLQEAYTQKEYTDWKMKFQNGSPTAAQIDALVSDPERLAFYAYSHDMIDRPLPTLPGYSNAAHKSLGKNEKDTKRKYHTFADCGETSLRNFFNILLYNKEEKKFDPALLKQVAEKNHLQLYAAPGKKTPKGLLAFYERNSDFSNVESDSVRDDWSRRVVSNLKSPAVNYIKPEAAPVCEINAGVKNMLAVIENLLGDPKLKDLKKPQEKWDQICQVFSREGFQLDWTVKGGSKESLTDQDTGVELQFTINDDPAFDWAFQAGHFFITDATEKGQDWRGTMGAPFMKKVSLNAAPLLIPWLIKQNNISDILQEIRKKTGHEMGQEHSTTWPLWSLPLRNNESKLVALPLILTPFTPTSAYPLLKRWMKDLPQDDLNTQAQVLNSILQANAGASFSKEREVAQKAVDRDQETSLVLSAKKGLLYTLRDLAKQGADLKKKKADGTLLHVAAREGHTAVVQELIKTHPELITNEKLVKGNFGDTPVHLAARNGHTAVVQELIKTHPELITNEELVKDNFRRTPLHLAAEKGHIAVVQELIKTHPELITNEKLVKGNFGDTPLHLAADEGHTAVVQELIKTHPELITNEKLVKNNDGDTPLHLAAWSGHVAVVQELIKTHPELITNEKLVKNNSGDTPLHRAIGEGHIAVVQELIKTHPELITNEKLAKGNNGDTPLHRAVARARTDVVQFLVKNPRVSLKELNEELDWTRNSVIQEILHREIRERQERGEK
jgi:ankyrin repeat protein